VDAEHAPEERLVVAVVLITPWCAAGALLAPSWEWSPKLESCLRQKMLALLASATPSLSLSHAESRVGCEARRSFCAALSSPNARAFELALLLAAEERPCEDVAVISNEVEVTISALAEKARSRLQLESLVGGDPNDPKCIAAAASRVLFGSGGAGAALFHIPRGERRAGPATAARDSPSRPFLSPWAGADEDDDEAFFSGSSQADYYDPRNSYLDAVLELVLTLTLSLTLTLTLTLTLAPTLTLTLTLALALALALTRNPRCSSGDRASPSR
jgi:hypothetical protein